MQQRNQTFRGVQDLLGEELCSDVLSVIATVLCNLWVAWGAPACAEWRGCEPETCRLLHPWPPSPLADPEVPGGTSPRVLAHVWYLSCTSRHYWNSSHDQQPQLRCSLPISFQGEGRGATHSLAYGSSSAETSALYSKDWDCSWKSREETSVQVTPAHGGRARQGRYPTCRFCPGLEVVLLPYGFAKDF